MGIVARLLALADLADIAALRSLPVRWLVMWYLTRADAVARDFVADYASRALARHWSPAVVAVRYGNAPADAANLAAALRALARIVCDLAAQLGLSCLQSCEGDEIGGALLSSGGQDYRSVGRTPTPSPVIAFRRCRDPTPRVECL